MPTMITALSLDPVTTGLGAGPLTTASSSRPDPPLLLLGAHHTGNSPLHASLHHLQ
uniref:Uncharacterized protein n=1 Tax=Ciona intestinalis TaxID=7719 RepID=H2XQX0_CIOIN